MSEMTIAPVATHGFFVDGRWQEDGDLVEIRAPYDGSLIARVIQGRREHADAAIAACRQSLRHHAAAARLRAPARPPADLRANDAAQRRIRPHSRPGSRQAHQGRAHRSRPRHLHLQRRCRRKHPHLRRISFPSTGRNLPPDAGASSAAFRSARSPASRHSIFLSTSSPTKLRQPSPPDVPWS